MATPSTVANPVRAWRGGVLACLLLAGCGAGAGGSGPFGEGTCAPGPLTETGFPGDLAIIGQGYFALGAPAPWGGPVALTRVGQFTIGEAGDLVALDGRPVVGFPADASGRLSGLPGRLRLLPQSLPPRATTTVLLRGNLEAEAALLGPFDPANPVTTSNLTATAAVFAADGAILALQVFFTRTGPGAWTWSALADGVGVEGEADGLLVPVAGGSLTFDPLGRLAAVTQASSLHPRGARAAQPLDFDLGDPTGGVPAGTGLRGTGLAGFTQFASASATTFTGQDGAPAGGFNDYRIGADGSLVGLFSNGDTWLFGRVAVAGFPSTGVLEPLGGSGGGPRAGSGLAGIGLPCQDGNACLMSGFLELAVAGLATCR